mgnify:CR=1 FL=1|tara:strand:- start:474212 stop:474769 length:558 start_codon:yes stop_codon:yes gene_type:complete
MACDIYYFLVSETYPDGIGSIDDPFLIAEGSLGTSQMQIIMDGIDAIYADMEPDCNPEYVLLASEEVPATVSIYKIVSDIYGQATKAIEEGFDSIFFGLQNVVEIDDPDVKMELLASFRDTYNRFDNGRYNSLVSAAKRLNQHALNSSDEENINEFLSIAGYLVSRDWANLSAISGYEIDPIYVE